MNPLATRTNGTSTRNGASRKASSSMGGASKASINLNRRDMPALDWIHVIFLFYSGAHNGINAWAHAENFLFFIFVFVGILSVEIMLWSIYKYWKSGQFIGRMLRIGKFAGMLAMFYATAGILAQAQTGSGNDWLTLYYQWILPTSAPVMFFFAFWIQSVDPIMTAERDTTAYAYLASIEERKEALDARRMQLDEARSRRKLKARIMKKKVLALHKESDSNRTRSTLKRASITEMPLLLEEVGVSVREANKQPKFTFLRSKYIAPKQLTSGNNRRSTNNNNNNNQSLSEFITEKK